MLTRCRVDVSWPAVVLPRLTGNLGRVFAQDGVNGFRPGAATGGLRSGIVMTPGGCWAYPMVADDGRPTGTGPT